MMGVYIANLAITIATSTILISFILTHDTMTKMPKYHAAGASLLLILCATCDFTGLFLDGNFPEYRVIHIIVRFIELSNAPVIPIVMSVSYFEGRKNLYKVFFIVASINAILAFISIFTGIMYYVTPDNVYHRGPIFFVYHLALLTNSAFFVSSVVRFNHINQNNNILPLILILLMIAIGLLCDTMIPGWHFMWQDISMGMALFYIYYCSIIMHNNPLTGLLNRRSFALRTKYIKKPAVILFFDINKFKEINDTYGHNYGDKCLVTVAEILKKVYVRYGYCYRIGGDEFCVIVFKNRDKVDEMNAQFTQLLDEKRKQDEKLPTVAIGKTYFDPKKERFSSALAKADKAMYDAKQQSEEISI